MKNISEIVKTYGVLPVINVTSVEMAKPLSDALCEGGLPLIEVTLRSACSLEAISAIRKYHPEMTVGAGTVLTPEDVDKALDAGAEFIVSPGYDPELIKYCKEKGVTAVPGCSTPAEIQDAVKNGLKTIKFFPAELSGGLAAIKLISGPFPDVDFIPTGGITFENLENYLCCEKVAACGGSFMASSALLKAGDYAAITANCKKAVALSLGFRIAHVGVNHPDPENAANTLNFLAGAFGSAETGRSICECMPHDKCGTHGHIGVYTHSMVRAMAYLSAHGVELDETSKKYDKAGNLTCIYFKNEIAGFAFHIVKD